MFVKNLPVRTTPVAPTAPGEPGSPAGPGTPVHVIAHKCVTYSELKY